MTFKVVVTPEAVSNLREAARFIRKDSPAAASRWIKGLRRAIRGLAKLPERCAFAPESREFGDPIRELLYGSGNRGTYRILFAIIDDSVFVLHVRHGSMLPLEF